jgi:polyisoprenoid-binding protein YceI
MKNPSKPENTNQTKWSIDLTHSELGFKVRHLMISHVRGTFKTIDGSIYTTGKDFTTAAIDLWIDPASISTGDEKRDEHLKGPEFFDAAKYAQISFVSNTIEQMDNKNHLALWGQLTMKGITKQIKLDVKFGGVIKDPWGNEKAGFEVSGKINRSDWGLVWNTPLETGGLMVGDEVSIAAEIELINLGEKDLSMELELKSDYKGIF